MFWKSKYPSHLEFILVIEKNMKHSIFHLNISYNTNLVYNREEKNIYHFN